MRRHLAPRGHLTLPTDVRPPAPRSSSWALYFLASGTDPPARRVPWHRLGRPGHGRWAIVCGADTARERCTQGQRMTQRRYDGRDRDGARRHRPPSRLMLIVGAVMIVASVVLTMVVATLLVAGW